MRPESSLSPRHPAEAAARIMPGRRGSDSPLINPDPANLGRFNAILTGTNTRYWVPEFEGSLSIKWVARGEALWRVAGRAFRVSESAYLVLNDRQPYSVEIDAARPVTTFCVFFARGFVEDVFHSSVTPEDQLLDAPQSLAQPPLPLRERLEPALNETAKHLRLLHRRMQRSGSESISESHFVTIAQALAREFLDASQRAARLPSVRAATREELLRRVYRGRDFMLGSLGEPCSLQDAARVAGLSPFHFHRAFTAIFRQAPHAFLTTVRLRRAAHLLREGNSSVTETCLECGFTSLGSFSSLFRRSFRVSPSAFRDSSFPAQ